MNFLFIDRLKLFFILIVFYLSVIKDFLKEFEMNNL